MSTTTTRRKRAVRAQADPVLHRRAEEIRSLAKRTVEDIIKIGRLLADAKRRIPHGGWLLWLEQEFGWSADTATNFMNLFKLSRRPKFRKIRNMAKGLPSVLLYALGGASGDVADEMMERIERGESVTAPQVKQYITVQKTEHVQRIVNPYYVKSPPEPPRIFNPVFGTRKPTPQITQEEIYRAGLRGGANRLIDALVHTRHDVREKAVEFVLGERQADREAFERAVRELAAALDRADGARRKGHLRVIEPERSEPDAALNVGCADDAS